MQIDLNKQPINDQIDSIRVDSETTIEKELTNSATAHLIVGDDGDNIIELDKVYVEDLIKGLELSLELGWFDSHLKEV